MDFTRREFIAAAGACACGALAGCVAINAVPLIEADADGTIRITDDLLRAGGQVKVNVPGIDGTVLLWRSQDGFHATSIACTHRASEVTFNLKENCLICPTHGSRFGGDGSVLNGPAKLPLRVYTVTRLGEKIRIEA